MATEKPELLLCDHSGELEEIGHELRRCPTCHVIMHKVNDVYVPIVLDADDLDDDASEGQLR